MLTNQLFGFYSILSLSGQIINLVYKYKCATKSYTDYLFAQKGKEYNRNQLIVSQHQPNYPYF